MEGRKGGRKRQRCGERAQTTPHADLRDQRGATRCGAAASSTQHCARRTAKQQRRRELRIVDRAPPRPRRVACIRELRRRGGGGNRVAVGEEWRRRVRDALEVDRAALREEAHIKYVRGRKSNCEQDSRKI
jgi:hypothetical protein